MSLARSVLRSLGDRAASGAPAAARQASRWAGLVLGGALALGCASPMDFFRGDTSRDRPAPAVESSPPPESRQAPDEPLPSATAPPAGQEPDAPAPPTQGQPTPAAQPSPKAAQSAAAEKGAAEKSSEKSSATPPGFFRIDMGEAVVPILVPRSEELSFDVLLSLGWLGDPTVGRVTMSSRVEPYESSLLVRDSAGSHPKEAAVLKMRAQGSYAVYELDESITSTILPQDWPQVIYRTVQTGSENRQRELMFGLKDGQPRARYRSDRHCKGCDERRHFVKPNWAWQSEHHCDKCKRAEHRVWRDPEERAIPAHTIDMLSGVYLARSMLVQGQERVQFKLLDQTKLWEVEIRRGDLRVVRVPAGSFRAVEVHLITRIPKGEKPRDVGEFEGLFGIHGSISIWMHPESGVPVLIRGQVPAGPMDLDVSIALREFSGTAAAFQPVR